MFFSNGEKKEMDASPDMHFFVGLDHRYGYVNPAWYRWYDFKPDAFEAKDCPYALVPSPIFDQCADKFELQDNKVIKRKEPVSTFGVHQCDYHGGWRASICTVTPMIKDSRVINLHGHAQLLPNHFIAQQKKIMNEIGISKKEMVMTIGHPEGMGDAMFANLFLMMMRYNERQVAHIRGKEVRTVYSQLNRLRFKLGVETNQQLKELAMENEWYLFLPKEFQGRELCYVI